MSARLLASLILLAVPVLAFAQPVIQMAPRPQPQIQAPAQPSPSETTYQSPEQMKAQINQLKRDKRALREQLALTLADLQALRVKLDSMTTPGGSDVTAQCVSETLSRNTAGASEDCSASGYTCAAVSGLCHRSCTVSTQCAGGFLCDTGVGRCVPPPAGD